MARLVLTMTMSLDGFFSGPDGELDWMTQAPDPEFSRDNVASFDHVDRGFIGYPTASGMLPYWLNAASDPQAPADQRALAEALNKLPLLISRREEPGPWPNAELLVVHDDEQLADAVRKEKARKRPRCSRWHPHRPDLLPPRARRRIRPHRAPRRARRWQARIRRQGRPGASPRQDLPVRSDTRTLPAKPLTAAQATSLW
jgi:hypothetical protein